MLFTATDGPRVQQPLLILQSSTSQSTIPILRQILNHNVANVQSILFCFLYDPSSLVDDPRPEGLVVHDWQSHVPGYDPNDQRSIAGGQEEMISAMKDSSARPLDVVIDSVNTLCSNIGSVSETCQFLRRLVSLVQERPSPSRLILHIVQPSPLASLLTQTVFSPSLTHVIAHPPALLIHLSREYLTPPPPASPEAKFWSVFLPLSERLYETERIVYGSSGDGCGGVTEFVTEVLIRGADGRKRVVERVLEGWSIAHGGPCELEKLRSLKGLQSAKPADELLPPDPTQNISFNLSLTASQKESKAQVPLPYAHEGKPIPNARAIYYDPDSADDIDDDDPDEDLDI